MAERFLDIAAQAIPEDDTGLDPAWLLLPPEERLRQHAIIMERAMKLEEAITGKPIARRMDRSVHCDVIKNAF